MELLGPQSKRQKNKCCVPGCDNIDAKRHRFPREENLFKQWVEMVQQPRMKDRTFEQIYMAFYVCHVHFDGMYVVPGTKRGLRTDAVPTLHLPQVEDASHKQIVENCENLETEFVEIPTSEFEHLAEPSPGLGLDEMNPTVPLNMEDVDYSQTEPRRVEEKPAGKPYFKSVRSYLPDCKRVVEVCRVCFRSLPDEELIKLYEETPEEDATHIKNMLETVLPNLDLRIYPNIVLCTKCTELLAYSYQLNQTWQRTEEKLKTILEKRKGVTHHDTDLVIVGKTKNVQNESLADILTSDENVPKKVSLFYGELNSNGPTVVSRKTGSYGPGPYICEQCGRVFEKKLAFQNHLHRHKYTKLRKKTMCEICGKLFYGIKSHVRTHTERQCKICKKEFISTSQLAKHIDSVHLKRRNSWQCHVCGKVFSLATSFRLHLTLHNPTKIYHCNICNKKFPLRSRLKNHLNRHVDEKKYKCEYCGKAIKYEQCLRQHVNIYHKNEAEFVCEICDKRLWRKINLDAHKYRIHGVVS